MEQRWQSPVHVLVRRDIRASILYIMDQKVKQMPSSGALQLDRLEEYATRLEVMLYSIAPSFDNYSDKTTLLSRIQHVSEQVTRQNSQAASTSR